MFTTFLVGVNAHLLCVAVSDANIVSLSSIRAAASKNYCGKVGCNGGTQNCAEIQIPQQNDPVDMVYLCYEFKPIRGRKLKKVDGN